jgi:hypothetical protein
MTFRSCKCGTRFSHPTRKKCNKCLGFSCPAPCGLPKMPEQETCGRQTCPSALVAPTAAPRRVALMSQRRKR